MTTPSAPPELTPGPKTSEFKLVGGTALTGLVVAVLSWLLGTRWHLNVAAPELYAFGAAISAGLYALARGIAKSGHAKAAAQFAATTVQSVEATIPPSVLAEMEASIEENLVSIFDKHLPKQIADQIDAVMQEYFPEETNAPGTPDPAHSDSGGTDAPVTAPPTSPPPVADPVAAAYDPSQIPGVEIVQ